MSTHNNFLNLLYLGTKHKYGTGHLLGNYGHAYGKMAYGRNAKSQSAFGDIAHYPKKRSARKTIDLIKVLLDHGARAARARPAAHSYLPECLYA